MIALCFHRIYERVVEAPYMDIPEDASFWLGQRNAAHGFFKVSINLAVGVLIPMAFQSARTSNSCQLLQQPFTLS